MFKVFEQVAIIKFLAVSGMNDRQISSTMGLTISDMRATLKLDHIPDELRFYYYKFKMERQVLFVFLKLNMIHHREFLDTCKDGKIKTFSDFKNWYRGRFGKEYNPEEEKRV